MTDTSLQPARRLRRGQFSRRRQVREAVGEAHAALQEIAGLAAPRPRRDTARWRQWAAAQAAPLARRWQQLRPRRSPALVLAGHMPTAAVVLFLGLAIFSQALGFSIAYSAAGDGGEGGTPLLIRGAETAAQDQAFAFAAAPMTVARRQAAADEDLSVHTVVTSSANVSIQNDVLVYTVREGDTLDSVAAAHGIAPYTIYWLNELSWPGNLVPGLALLIPPISGVPHTVASGETLETIADLYGVRPGNIVGYPLNGLKYPYTLQAGQEIFVPGGIVEIPNYRAEAGHRPPPTLLKMPGGEKLSWPAAGTITAPFGWSRSYGGYHKGLDIANDLGTPIYAAASGLVIEAGWGGLGWYVVIDHENGFRTEYGHLAESPLVASGQRVERGQRIGRMGSTYGEGGYATGVHLHLAVRHRGVLIDPLPLLEQ